MIGGDNMDDNNEEVKKETIEVVNEEPEVKRETNEPEKDRKGFAIAGILGQEANFGLVGLRWGLGLGYSTVDFDDGKNWNQEVFSTELSFDMILNFVNKGNFSFGIFDGYWVSSIYLIGTS